ncbi:hypothetical protein EUGRSUZ_D02528 [Eucalyptus grandis]|uniref:Uncharacterized protein n=2 Tax=Eucalyptus grandis TaxID=71139 RepID=A0A059CJD7_EUCGR|nr:hypothetical protein EUGRSUZ_D02528 [Eucalyptus grandis]
MRTLQRRRRRRKTASQTETEQQLRSKSTTTLEPHRTVASLPSKPPRTAAHRQWPLQTRTIQNSPRIEASQTSPNLSAHRKKAQAYRTEKQQSSPTSQRIAKENWTRTATDRGFRRA